MTEIRDWHRMKDMYVRLLVERTGADLETWKERILTAKLADEQSLRSWLSGQGVTGYAQTFLVMEEFGYPDFMLRSADELINGQYADRQALRPILDAILALTAELGQAAIQTRKTYISLVTPRRTFARVQPTTKTRLDLALRLEGQEPGGRLQPSRIHETTPLQISLTSVDDVDDELMAWLKKAYDQNA